MTGYTFYKGKPHYYRNGVLKRFRETIDPTMTLDEMKSVLSKMRFPIADGIEMRNGKKQLIGYYDANLIEDMIVKKKSEILDKLREKREYDSNKLAGAFKPAKKQKTVFDTRSIEEIEAEYHERQAKERERLKKEREAIILKRLKDEEEKERMNPEEDMDKVSDELLRNDDVYYESKKEGGEKINEEDEENNPLEEEMKRWYDKDNSLMMTFDQFKKMIYHFVNYSRDVHDNITDFNVKEETTDFGKTWHVNSPDGSFRFALYIYDDDPKTAYLSNVFVDEKMRGNGIGNTILGKADEMARKIGTETLCLKVKKDSFVHQWYRRKGYVDFQPDSDDKDHMWMKKKL